jgi:hypothetical protein
MKEIFKKPLIIYILLAFGIALPLCVFPINIFDGEIIVGNELQNYTEKVPLSLSYFFGLGYNEEDMNIIKDFYLLPTGYLLAFIFIFGIPALLSYRIYLKQKK